MVFLSVTDKASVQLHHIRRKQPEYRLGGVKSFISIMAAHVDFGGLGPVLTFEKVFQGLSFTLGYRKKPAAELSWVTRGTDVLQRFRGNHRSCGKRNLDTSAGSSILCRNQ